MNARQHNFAASCPTYKMTDGDSAGIDFVELEHAANRLERRELDEALYALQRALGDFDYRFDRLVEHFGGRR